MRRQGCTTIINCGKTTTLLFLRKLCSKLYTGRSSDFPDFQWPSHPMTQTVAFLALLKKQCIVCTRITATGIVPDYTGFPFNETFFWNNQPEYGVK